MTYPELRKLREKTYFTVEDLRGLLTIKPESARVLCSRYVKNGFFVRLKRNFYVLNERWENLTREDYFKVSNILQVPSYISLLTALSFYEVTTQIQRDYFESVSLKRSVNYNIKGASFSFYKIKRNYYFDFVRENDIFIATKEKAFIDSIYLYSFGKYKIDFSSLDIDKLDKSRITEILKLYPQKTINIARRLCGI